MSIARLMQMASAGVTTGGTGSEWTDPDLTNASYDSVSFSVAGQDGAPRDLQFDETGTKLFVLGVANDNVFEYSLSTAWDVSTASYTSSVSVGGTSYGMYFRGDGTKLYIMDIGGTVFQWSLSSAWDVTTATYDAVSFSVTSQDTSARDVAFSEDGTKMYVLGAYSDKTYQYTLTTAWDISTATYDSVEFSVIWQDSAPLSIVFNPSGTKFWIYGALNQSVYEYDLSTAWDLSTASYSSSSFSVSGQAGYAIGMTFSSDGSKMYITDNTGDYIYQYSTVTPAAPATWTDPDLANASYDSVSFVTTSQDFAPFDCHFNSDGTKMYLAGAASDTVYQYSLSTAWDLSTISYDSVSFSVSAQDTAPLGFFFKPDGTKFYLVGNNNNRIFEYDISTAWDISTASYSTNSFSVNSQDVTPADVFFKDDGLQMYVVGLASDRIYQYTLSTAWDVSTASYDSKFLSTVTEDINPSGLFFNPDGTKVWMAGTTSDSVHQYTLSTAWDISTATYDNVLFDVSSQDDRPRGFLFKSDGSKMYVTGSITDTIYQYSTA